MSLKVKFEDEYPHNPISDPLWWENYHFNAYDPLKKIGITTYVAIKPFLGSREEIITIYPINEDAPLFFQHEIKCVDNAFNSGSLQMEILEPLRTWRIKMKGAFQETEKSIPVTKTRNVEFNFRFKGERSPYKYITERGDRYEQPGSLKGKIKIGNTSIKFHGTGIRDHSWEIRNIPGWGEYYALMGRFGKKHTVSCVYMDTEETQVNHGWVEIDECSKISSIRASSKSSGNILKRCTMNIETSHDTIKIDIYPLSFITISMGKEQKEVKAVEMLVEMKIGSIKGYGFLWYNG